MFKSIETYSFTNNSTGVTITGPGMISILLSSIVDSSAGSSSGNPVYRKGYIDVDGQTIEQPDVGTVYLFKSSCKIYTQSNSKAQIKAVVGLF